MAVFHQICFCLCLSLATSYAASHVKHSIQERAVGTPAPPPPPPCNSNPCQHGGTCSNRNNNNEYSCNCYTRWGGSRCETDRRPCDNNPCYPRETCTNGSGGKHTCICKIEYNGDDCSEALYPTPAPEPAPSCFPGDALVSMETGEKQMEDVVQGDKVLAMAHDGSLIYSDVVMVMHGDSDVTNNFYVMHTDQEPLKLRLTAEHMLFVQGPNDNQPRFKMASNVDPGDHVFTFDEHNTFLLKKAKVMNVTQALFRGIYAPVTLEGTIVVDDVLASCYAFVESQQVIHAAFWPARALYKWFPMIFTQGGQTNQEQIHWYPGVLDTVITPMLNAATMG